MNSGRILKIFLFSNFIFFFQSSESSERYKRELKFPKGASIDLVLALANYYPKGPLTGGLIQLIEFEFGFPFPAEAAFGKAEIEKKIDRNSYGSTNAKKLFFVPKKKYAGEKYRVKRNSMEIKKKEFTHKFQNLLERLGYDGFACVSRLQCELIQVSPENSLPEEILHALFVPSSHLEEKKCEKFVNECPLSLLHVMLHSQQSLNIPE